MSTPPDRGSGAGRPPAPRTGPIPRPSEVLVTSTVHTPATGSGTAFGDRHGHTLTTVPERLFAVEHT